MATGTITNLAFEPNTDSVRIKFDAVPGAADYRCFVQGQDTSPKYAGLWRTATSKTPITMIEMNNVPIGVPVTFIVHAVDAVGPVPRATLGDINNAPLYPDAYAKSTLKMLYMNADICDDGTTATNGQGDPAAAPKAIATGSITLTLAGLTAIPSSADAEQTLFETFPGTAMQCSCADDTQSVFTDIVTDATANTLRATMNVPSGKWSVAGNHCDVINSMLMTDKGHLMSICLDGSTPGDNQPMHVGHGVIAFSPETVIDISGGKIVHMTGKWDSHLGPTSRRWVGMQAYPANDPLQNFDFDPSTQNYVNTSNQALFIQPLGTGQVAIDVFSKDATGTPIDTAVGGAAGQGLHVTARPVNGLGLDLQSRWDVFFSATHIQIYEEGVLVPGCDMDIPAGLIPWTQIRLGWASYCYHTLLEQQELAAVAPYEDYWLDFAKFGDLRHFDDLGFEVLPSTTLWTDTAKHIGLFALSTTSGGSTGGTGTTGTGTGGTTSTPPPAFTADQVAAITAIVDARIKLADEAGVAALG